MSAATARPHRHFGYWINRASGQARCYECQYQFVGDETSAEDWEFDGARQVVDREQAHTAARAVAAEIAREQRLGNDQAGFLAVLLAHLVHPHPSAWVWRNGRIQQRVIDSLTRRELVVADLPGCPRPAPAVERRYLSYLGAAVRPRS